MTALGSPDLASELVIKLEEAAGLLEAGDPEAAALAMASAVGSCPQMSQGALGPEGIATARRLLERCRQAELGLRKKLNDEMGSLATSRRAVAAYDR
jgi:hypothetical protein